MPTLDTPITALSSVGKTTAGRLKRIGITTANDLLWHLPRNYDDLSEVFDIATLQPQTKVTIRATVDRVTKRMTRYKRMKMTESVVSDDTGSIKIIWFNQPYIAQQLQIGDEIFVSGEVKENKQHQLQFTNPTYEKVSHTPTHTARIVPTYPSTANITQKQLRFLISQVLPLADAIADYIPEYIQQQYNLIPLPQALHDIHAPEKVADYMAAQYRLKFDELFFTSLNVQLAKRALQQAAAPSIFFDETLIKQTVDKLPFTLTDDQRKVAWRIFQDIEKSTPMNRLVQGDVGSGKTIVALLALINTAAQKKQGIFLAPTEILAEQHYQTTKNICTNIPVFLLTRTNRKLYADDEEIELSKKEITEKIKKTTNCIIIGTHALLQEHMTYSDVGLVVIDEQHRFGVKQRHALQDTTPEIIPHFLSMTATPIPRSLTLTLYGDLDISLIKTKPQHRKNIITRVVTKATASDEYKFIAQEIDAGHQAFVICPLIEESDTLGVASATTTYDELQKNIFPHYRIGLLHGKLKKQEKEAVMESFRNKKIDILVATAVVEVGVDIPNATVMLIKGAERFGLAQLHQFRGRVGRSDKQSYCLLMPDNFSPQTKERLSYLTQYAHGFEIAEQDLQMRGPGDLYGYKQSGLPPLQIASLADLDIMEQAKQAVEMVLEKEHSTEMEALQAKLQQQHAIHFE